MRTTLFALAITISGMTGNLPAAPIHHASIHKVRKGETAARIARDNGISLGELRALNPGLNLARLHPGIALKVHGESRTAQIRTAVSAPEATPAVPPATVAPLAPLPGTPAVGTAPLVHLERILPSQVDSAPPIQDSLPGKPGPAASIAVPAPLIAGMRQAQPKESLEDEPDEPLPVPSRLEETVGFQPADPANLNLLWPVETRTISSAWGPRIRTRVTRIKARSSARYRRVAKRYLGSHKGVDLSAPKGKDIFAALDGEVVASGKQKGYGNYVALDHGNGVVTLYAHCNRNFVQVGTIVHRGQKIAEVGRTGNATGPHVHFELRLDDVPQNPLPFMNDMDVVPPEMMAQNHLAVPPESDR